MLDYIKNLLPRLQQYSKTLDHIELFVDQPWILRFGTGERYLYIFQRGGNLVVTINGIVTKGNWEYIAPAKALLITLSGKQFLLRRAFVEDGLMFLKVDGTVDEPWLFTNERKIPDPSDYYIKEYLTNIQVRIMGLQPLKLTNGSRIYVKHSSGRDFYYDDDTGSDADKIRFGERYPGSIPASLQLLYYQVGGLPGIYKCGICNQKFLDRYCETT